MSRSGSPRVPVHTPPSRRRGAAGLRTLPHMNELLGRDAVQRLVARNGRRLVTSLLRERLDALRTEVRRGGLDARGLEARLADLDAWVEREARSRTASTLRPVINATGVILHTNLGRAILSEEAVRRVAAVARSYTTLEYDLASGRRGSRGSHLDRLLALLFPGRAAHVVNNNAAAVLLALNTLAEGREVVVSRGELVEIGGSFRIPDIMARSGAILREVGTTNRTRLTDYERAMGAKTGLLLKVHRSNYRIEGFTAEAALKDIVRLGRRRRVPVLFDQGSGNLSDLARRGIQGEPRLQEALAAGADVICCSGDKLLGGPQAGLLIGRANLIRKIRDNPLSRALRVDKMTHAALEATLLEYVRDTAAESLPVIRMMSLTGGTIERRARAVAEEAGRRAPGRLEVSIRRGSSVPGGGSAPGEGLDTVLLAVRSGSLSARALEERLRRHDPPIIARIERNHVLLDLRTVPEEEDRAVAEALVAAAG